MLRSALTLPPAPRLPPPPACLQLHVSARPRPPRAASGFDWPRQRRLGRQLHHLPDSCCSLKGLGGDVSPAATARAAVAPPAARARAAGRLAAPRPPACCSATPEAAVATFRCPFFALTYVPSELSHRQLSPCTAQPSPCGPPSWLPGERARSPRTPHYPPFPLAPSFAWPRCARPQTQYCQPPRRRSPPPAAKPASLLAGQAHRSRASVHATRVACPPATPATLCTPHPPIPCPRLPPLLLCPRAIHPCQYLSRFFLPASFAQAALALSPRFLPAPLPPPPPPVPQSYFALPSSRALVPPNRNLTACHA